MTKSTSSIPVLERNNVTAIKNSDKATMLNQYFSECFNKAQPPLSCGDSINNEGMNECPEDFLCTEEEVFDMLASLDVSKANGPDGISAKMLKGTAHSITPSLTKLFNISISTGLFPEAWKVSSTGTKMYPRCHLESSGSKLKCRWKGDMGKVIEVT